jgi:hypothetical protein
MESRRVAFATPLFGLLSFTLRPRRLWFWSILWLGIPSTILSAVTGAAVISQDKSSSWVGGLALIAAVLTSLITYLDPSKRAGIHHTLAKGYERLYHEVGYFVRIRLSDVDADIKRLGADLDSFTTRLDELNQSSPALPGRAYRKAARIINGTDRGEVFRDPDHVPNREFDTVQKS